MEEKLVLLTYTVLLIALVIKDIKKTSKINYIEQRSSFLELKEYKVEDFIGIDCGVQYPLENQVKVVASSSEDYGYMIRFENRRLYRRSITKLNQSYYLYSTTEEDVLACADREGNIVW